MNTTLIKNFPADRVDDAVAALAKSWARLARGAAKAGQAAPIAPTLGKLAKITATPPVPDIRPQPAVE